MTIEQHEKNLAKQGIKPWGLIIPGAGDAPEGSELHQYRKKGDPKTYFAVVAPDGTVVRTMGF
ncbi:hypothetical protein LCGC14_2210260 [marine sediment metagenome]|uniref:Uncharacterized protein n=1 Tax=marine sediment metagenome TaxID=412755 RepID=A0A0F9DDY5_9ZZZZ